MASASADVPTCIAIWMQQMKLSMTCLMSRQVEGVTHGDGVSIMGCGSGMQIRSAAALDATGHALKLVEFDQKFDPGYQVWRGLQ